MLEKHWFDLTRLVLSLILLMLLTSSVYKTNKQSKTFKKECKRLGLIQMLDSFKKK